MIRSILAILLFSASVCLTSQVEAPSALGQAKKEKKKDKTDEPNVGDIKEDVSRILPVFDPGSHTQAITALGFTKDKSKLITVGQDFTIQVWNTTTGARLDILRLPCYGREKGYDPGRWDIATVSADGNRVAIGGQMKYLNDLTEDNSARLMVVDVVKRTAVRVMLRTGRNRAVTALTFSPDGNKLAVGIERGPKEDPVVLVVGDLANRIKNARPGVQTMDCQQTALTTTPTTLAFASDGKSLLAAGGTELSIWAISEGGAPKATLVKKLTTDGITHAVGWSPDGKQFARAAHGEAKSDLRAIELWNADGAKVKTWKGSDLNAVFAVRPGLIYSVTFLNPNTLYFVANGLAEKKDGGASLAGTIDIATGKDQRVVSNSDGILKNPIGTSSADGSLVAVTVTGNTEVLVGPPTAAGPRVRCGSRNDLPYHVGWAKDPAKPGFAWTVERHFGKETPTAEVLRFGFDLTKVEPAGAIKSKDFNPALVKIGDWTLEFLARKAVNDDDPTGNAQLKQNGKLMNTFHILRGIGNTLIANGEKPPLVASAHRIEKQGDVASINKADGAVVVRLLPQVTRIHDMAASPDGRFLICTTGTPRVIVYRTDGSAYPMFSFAQLNGEWVLWTPEGYYAASPGGERMFGWASSNGPNALATFHPAEKFARQFRRPDIIKLAIEKGSVALALKELKTKPAEVETILPPKADLQFIRQTGEKVFVRATATSPTKDKPVTSMRLLLNGIPQPADRYALKVTPGMPAEVEWEIIVPAGKHNLQLKAGNDETAALSEPLVVTGPQSSGPRPTLYRVCVGINDYDESGLRLKQAAKDATDVFAALEQNCVGPLNRFGVAKGDLILNKDATCDAILKSLSDIRRKAKNGDLLVVFFAGHGVKPNDAKQPDNFYLLTREANTSKSLKGISLSGDELSKALGGFECEVLFIMDACHSAAAVKSFRPATDTLTRTLTSGGDSAAVTILAAAAESEVANGDIENGHFTNALLKALRVERGVHFDPFERVLNAAHIWTTVLAEVRNATDKQQNPTLYAPGSPPIVRDVLQSK